MKYNEFTIKKLIKEYFPLNIPYYQREYVWEGNKKKNNGRNFDKFILDIANEYFENTTSNYFIGNIAFSKTHKVDVVDGQQRMTTLVLLLSILADNFCSVDKKKYHKEIVYNSNGDFIIQEESYLTNELEGSLNYKSYSGTGYRIELDKTIKRAIELIRRNYGNKSTPEFDGLYEYILNNVLVILLEYNNDKDALRYFLNINSLSIELTSVEIFLTILSQALKISESEYSIYQIKDILKTISLKYDKINEYDIIEIFLSSYYRNDKDINDLKDLKVGKWMSYYHNEVYGERYFADPFCRAFIQYLKDIDFVLGKFQGKSTPINKKSPIFLSYSLLKYHNYEDLVEFLGVMFKSRHNYLPNDKKESRTIYKQNNDEIDVSKLEAIAIRLNLTIINNYIRNTTKRLLLLKENIETENNIDEKKNIDDILMDTKSNINQIFSLNYLSDHQSVPKPDIKDKSKTIRVILALQQGLLSYTADDSYSYYEYIADLLNGNNFTIEHIYSIKEFTDENRREEWIKRGKFIDALEFDTTRSSFENLSLLNKNTNSSASDTEIYGKLIKYKNARDVLRHGDEYLIQSFVDKSNFYENSNIQKLNLPERVITNISHNTWEHSSNNRMFLMELLEKALDGLVLI